MSPSLFRPCQLFAVSGARARAPFEAADQVVRLLDLRELPLDERAHVRGHVPVERRAVRGHRHVLAAPALAQNRALVAAFERRAQTHPAAVERGDDAPGPFGVAAEPPHLVLQLAREARALPRVSLEHLAQLRIPHALGGRAEALLAVAAGFDQAVERRDDFLIAWHRLSPLSVARPARGGRG